ncbi:MAG: hydroxymethylbilane synthase [Gammaproteobacteria bacterium]|jgi:hydroxymethylbilane synthase|nr:hydroxymethylbilane synthase [Gammaproteobacteria bacterium]
MARVLRIATRKSPLALWQAEHVKAALGELYPELKVQLMPMSTRGDEILDRSLAAIGGKGLFLKELERAMLAGEADLAVHSMKDVPAELPEGLHIAAVLTREDPRDAIVSNQFNSLDELPQGAVLGTSSLRRQAQMQNLRPDLSIQPARGNVGTRLQRLDEGNFTAIMLAYAGLKRLGLADRAKQVLEIDVCLPAVGQGIVGIECRRDDSELNKLLARLNNQVSDICLRAERAFASALQASCHAPVAAHAVLEGTQLHLRGLVAMPDGSRILKGDASGESGKARELGLALAEELIQQGAGDILRSLEETG